MSSIEALQAELAAARAEIARLTEKQAPPNRIHHEPAPYEQRLVRAVVEKDDAPPPPPLVRIERGIPAADPAAETRPDHVRAWE